MQLLTDGGHRLACGCGGAGDKEIDRRVPAGRYFVAVRSVDGEDGRYTLSRLTRTITRSQMLVEGAASATVAPGTTVSLTLAVFPAVDGRATMLVERFDPLAGWLFDAQFRPAVAGGRGTVAFHPRSVGRWRVTGSFEETRRASASSGGSARFRVAEPLTE